MASIYATNSSSSTSTSGLKGYGGLASGLDRDSLIEAMTTGTRSKIAKQKQKIQSLKWKQEAYQSISSKLIEFSSNYLSMSSKNSLISSSFFAKSDLTVNGTNSKYVKVSGYSNISDSLAINGVKQLAKKASYTAGMLESQGLEIGVIDWSKEQSVDVLAGGTLEIQMGADNKETYTITLKQDGDYSKAEDVKKALNECLESTKNSNGKALSTYMEFELDGEKLVLKDNGGNGVKITGGSAVEYLGYRKKTDASGVEEDSYSLTASEKITYKKKLELSDLKGKTIDFMYNGTSISVELPLTDIEESNKEVTANNQSAILESIKKSLQEAFDKKIGLNRISVELEVDSKEKPVKLVFKTKIPDGTKDSNQLEDDPTSVLKVTGGTAPLDALGLSVGDSNHLNLNSKVSSFMGDTGIDSTYALKINSESIDITGNDTIQNVIDKINKSDAKVKVTYLETANRFQITSTEEGGSGKIFIDTSSKLARTLFGIKICDLLGDAGIDDYTLKINDSEIKGITGDDTIESMIDKINKSAAKVKVTYLEEENRFQITSTEAEDKEVSIDRSSAFARALFGCSEENKVSDFLGNSGINDYTLTINNVKINDITGDDTIESMIDKINNSAAKVKVTYLEEENRFQITSTEEGNKAVSIDRSSAFARALFGCSEENKVSDFLGNSEINGYTLKINDVEIKGITGDDTIKSMIDKINNSDAKVEVTYLEGENRFQIISTEEGNKEVSIDRSSAFASALFDKKNTMSNIDLRGQDAIINVSYDGVATEIRRSSNTFDLEGLAVTISGEFGYTGDNLDTTAEAVTFSAKANTEKVIDSVKEMVEAYNSIIEAVNKEISTKPNRSYTPLTDEQKEEMSESQIEKWEEKAKEGLLFSDSDLTSLASEMRSIFKSTLNSLGIKYTEIEKIGITPSSTWSDNGKLVIDEEKLESALETNPESVSKLFAGDGTSNGLMTNIKNVFEQYAKKEGSSKGILVDKAGSSLAPLSLLTNTIYKQLEDMDKTLKSLQAYLTTEQDRYISKFASLETVIAQMNSQSSWLSQQFSA